MDEFRAGVTATLRSWSALRTAVESGWGGVHSQQKAEDLRSNIYDHFDGAFVPPKQFADLMDLEDALAVYMEEEFSLTLEDGSEKQIADVIWRLYATCAKGDVTLAQQVVQAAEQAVMQSPLVSSGGPMVQSSENDDDDDEEEEEEEDEEMMDAEATDPSHSRISSVGTPLATCGSVAEYASQPLFGPIPKTRSVVNEPPLRQLGEAPPATEELVLDEDGFAPVVAKKKAMPRKPE